MFAADTWAATVPHLRADVPVLAAEWAMAARALGCRGARLGGGSAFARPARRRRGAPRPRPGPHRKGKVEPRPPHHRPDLLRGLPGFTGGPRDAAGRLDGPLDDRLAVWLRAAGDPVTPLPIEIFAGLFAQWADWYKMQRPPDWLDGRIPLQACRAPVSSAGVTGREAAHIALGLKSGREWLRAFRVLSP